MSKIKICDICKRRNNKFDCFVESYKVKKKDDDSIFDLLFCWERIDICTDCLREIRKIVLKGKKYDY